MTKAALRKIYKEKRELISPLEKSKLTDLLLINFQKIQLPFIRCVHTYMAMHSKNEIDTQQITRYLKFRNPGLIICVPKINITTLQMENIIYTEDTGMIINNFGIEEPLTGDKINAGHIDLVLTPLLTFDKKGFRVGFGKGFYDKFFTQCRSDVIKTGLSFFEPTEIIEDTNQFDIPLNYCVTPKNIYKF
ncbi:MAG: 5-formyltetrahydrofolate cyclo-ligase [Ginsengibacter sp.]